VAVLSYPWTGRLTGGKILLHILYWASFVLVFGIIWGSYSMNFRATLTTELVSLPIRMAVVYATIYLLLPRYYYTSRLPLFIAAFVTALLAAAVLQRVVENTIILPRFLSDWGVLPISNPIAILRNILNFNIYLALPFVVSILTHVSRVQHRQQEAEKEKLEAELSLLKNQIQPHFLFNTLNNIYSLSLKGSSESVGLILKFSDLLRYMLYETESSHVSLEKEVAFIRSYVEIEAMRSGDRTDVTFTTTGDFSGVNLPPMLLFPYVENAFKHCDAPAGEMTRIRIDLVCSEGRIDLTVENSVRPERRHAPSDSRGIGLSNVRRRTALLFPGRHEIDVSHTDSSYLTRLTIHLDE